MTSKRTLVIPDCHASEHLKEVSSSERPTLPQVLRVRRLDP